jgi:hypothetical protein
MFDAIKRWMGTSKPVSGAESRVLTAWAKDEGHAIKTVSGKAHGMVIETRAGWRVEWGPSQRPYFHGQELRFRCDSGLSPDVQMLWLSKAMAQNLESDVFQRFTDAMQTKIDSSLPDEMRWLAMHAKVLLTDHPLLARRFLLLSNAEAVTLRWLDAELLTELETAAASWWTDALIALMTVNRGILTIRMSGDGVEPNQLKMVGRLFDVAARRLTAVAA